MRILSLVKFSFMLSVGFKPSTLGGLQYTWVYLGSAGEGVRPNTLQEGLYLWIVLSCSAGVTWYPVVARRISMNFSAGQCAGNRSFLSLAISMIRAIFDGAKRSRRRNSASRRNE